MSQIFRRDSPQKKFKIERVAGMSPNGILGKILQLKKKGEREKRKRVREKE
jgi:hypothetical protein